MSTADLLVILSNFVLALVTIIGALITLVDIHKDDEETLRMMLKHPLGRPPHKHDDGEDH